MTSHPAAEPSAHEGFVPDAPIRCRDFRIGAIGAGFIMADVHLAAYREAGFPVVAIASRTPAKAAQVAQRHEIPTVHETPEALISDPQVQIVDIAYPPDQQPALIRLALAQPHVKGVLAQKPLALDLETARALAEEAQRAGKPLSVNQNMRFDQSMRVLKQLLDRGELGAPVLASIEMRAIPHWQEFLKDYGRLTLANMGVHHLDVLRFLFGEPEDIYTAARPDPRTGFAHEDGICCSTLRFRSGLLALSLEDVWTGPHGDGFDAGIFIKWRVEGTEGVAEGTIGWPDYPDGSPSTLRYSSRLTTGGQWREPRWTTRWFPQAFAGVMEQLQWALSSGKPPLLDVADNVKTMALVEAGYRSLQQKRAVPLSEFGI
ncbi:Gfo/Idh/MocA family protein [Pseudorhodoferax soli]|uniref:Putative dehydrogenase n=1 Tax=Pseudorhodoferax soli TaxID=545864 RepID=A0A368XDU9_9BURK|nr:Gfo/Idh/MocA family oxidoreductase [Pseudorhodoferax soli]PZP98241.1 MAG: oxidoreductase [Variovorax paradoxus]PZQ09602.1 MAG: oxidoreductase [Variovorax paradoxus]RCW66161.1 putative dehydrogenase [Pseudorhodoferax soli]